MFKQLQTHDISLQPLWDKAHKGNKQFFIIDGLLVCLTSTLNTVSHALVVPQQLRKKVLIAAHDGFGHGVINTTRSLLNKHFTWPGLADDVRKHVQACQKCLKHTTVVLLQCACEHLDPPPNHFLGAKFCLATTLTTGWGTD